MIYSVYAYDINGDITACVRFEDKMEARVFFDECVEKYPEVDLIESKISY